jgi:hypothetical protein
MPIGFFFFHLSHHDNFMRKSKTPRRISFKGKIETRIAFMNRSVYTHFCCQKLQKSEMATNDVRDRNPRLLLEAGGGGGGERAYLATAATQAATAIDRLIARPAEEHPRAAAAEPSKEIAGNSNPRKTAIALTAFLACLSFLIIAINLTVSFITDLVKNDKLWISLNKWLNENKSKCDVGI